MHSTVVPSADPQLCLCCRNSPDEQLHQVLPTSSVKSERTQQKEVIEPVNVTTLANSHYFDPVLL